MIRTLIGASHDRVAGQAASLARARTLRAACLILLAGLFWAFGCATGGLFEAGRLHESVVVYDRAFSDGERLRLEYTTEISNRDGVALRKGHGAARFSLSALTAQPEHTVDAFPLDRIEPGKGTGREQSVALLIGDFPPPAGDSFGLALRVRVVDGRHVALRLAGVNAFEGAHSFHSVALSRHRTAWWVYPLLPLALVYDAVSAPILVLPALPYFVMRE